MAWGLEALARHFWKKVDKNGPIPVDSPELGPCWIFNGSRKKGGGYGLTSWRDKTVSAHRLAYELANGEIPDGMTIDHRCHGPSCAGGPTCLHRPCVNPAHLTLATPKENTLRSPTTPGAINAAKTHCVNGHEFTPDNTRYGYPRGIESRICRICRNTRQRERSRRARLSEAGG